MYVSSPSIRFLALSCIREEVRRLRGCARALNRATSCSEAAVASPELELPGQRGRRRWCARARKPGEVEARKLGRSSGERGGIVGEKRTRGR